MMALARYIVRFFKDVRGVAATEFALIVPLLLILLLLSATFFDYFQQRQSVERSIHTVGDLLSRERTSLSQNRLNFMRDIVAEMARTRPDGVSLRVTSMEGHSGSKRQLWQQGAGANWPGGPIDQTLIPTLANGDSVLLIEVHLPYTPIFSSYAMGFGDIVSMAIYRPRFSAAIAFR